MIALLRRLPDRPVPPGLLGMLALVAAVELFLGSRSQRFTTDHAFSWAESARASKYEGRGCNLLGFGDSLVKFGVLPQVIEDRSGWRSYNLALLNGSPPASYFLLRRALASGAAPKVVVVDLMPAQLARDPRDEIFQRAWPELLNSRDAVDLAWSTRDAVFLGRLATGMTLPSLRSRHEIRRALHALLEGRNGGSRGAALALRHIWNVNRGAQVAARKRHRARGPESPDDAPLPAGWEANPVTTRYVRRFLDLASARGITVVWLLPPITRSSPARREMLDPAYAGFVARTSRQYPNIVVIDGRRSRYDPAACFVDGAHLNHNGASALSASLASLLDRLAPAPEAQRRWLALPDYRSPGFDIRIADGGIVARTLALENRRPGDSSHPERN